MSWKAYVFQDIIVLSDFVRIKTFSHGQTLTHNNLSVKYTLFTDKLGIGDYLHNLFPSAVAYQ